MKYVDTSAVLRVLFAEPGPSVPLAAGDQVLLTPGFSLFPSSHMIMMVLTCNRDDVS